MSPRRVPGKKLLKMLLPIVGLLLLVVAITTIWLVVKVTRPPRRAYLVTPQTFAPGLSESALKTTDEQWPNHDGTKARGWLLRGTPGSPAVILLHPYGKDRSWLYNLGVNLNEKAHFTVLCPDLRGHGQEPLVSWTSFGGKEADDLAAAIEFLRDLKVGDAPLVGGSVGVYGVEMGAYVALREGARNRDVRALVLDSVPAEPSDVLNSAVKESTGLSSSFFKWLARGGTRIYFLGGYDNTPSCEAAKGIGDKSVLLLSGAEPPDLHASTASLAQCFPHEVEKNLDLPLSGFNNLPAATGEQGDAYGLPVRNFFLKTLQAGP